MRELTGSQQAEWILENWDELLPRFIKVFPHEYKRVLGVSRVKHELRFPQPAGLSGSDRAGAAWVKSPDSWNTNANCRNAAPSTERVNDWFEIYQDFPRG